MCACSPQQSTAFKRAPHKQEQDGLRNRLDSPTARDIVGASSSAPNISDDPSPSEILDLLRGGAELGEDLFGVLPKHRRGCLDLGGCPAELGRGPRRAKEAPDGVLLGEDRAVVFHLGILEDLPFLEEPRPTP